MYLKRLEIQGFKSFAGKNTFEFDHGVTAVVGPNGSGKSNLADALRWVLGEQNPRVLRSRKSDEIVFAGGRQRPPAGFAEVSMVLDNADGWLPIGFDEVVVTRRLHRSGDGEYQINRARVRLRDLLDLLSRGRVGQNSYAIMGQGLVDQVLNLHPEERRALIEEAAEVRRHRLKIQDAVERLSATRDNLDRVDLLVGEIGPRLQQLAVQAQRAAEYGELTTSLAEALQLLFAGQWAMRTAALAEARTLYESHTKQLLRAQAAANAVESELGRCRAELQEQRTLAAGGEAAVLDLDERVRRGRQRLELLAERRTMLAARVAELESDIAVLLHELAELSRAEEAGNAGSPRRGALQAEIELQRARMREAEQAAGAAVRATMNVEDELRQARGQAAAVEERLNRLQRTRRSLERETEDLQGRRNTLLARLRKHGADTLRAGRELKAAEAQLAGRGTEIQLLRRQQQNARDGAERAEAAAREAANELESARARLELLGRLREEHAGANGALNALTEAAARAGRDSPPRLLAVLAELLRVPKGLEQAIAAALEDQLNAVIVPASVDADAAVATLSSGRSGRATIVPLGDLKPVHALNLSSERGVIGVAARLIKCEARYRELIDTMLGRFVVVEDLQTARNVVRRGLGTAVTLDGVVLRPTGIVSAGHAGSAALAFAYHQELEQLEGAIAGLNAAAAATGEQRSLARDQQRAAEARLREAEAALEALQSRKRRLQEEVGGSRGLIVQLRNEALFLRTAAAAAGERRQAQSAESSEIDVERRRQAQYVRSAQLTVEDARRALEAARRPVEELRAAVAEAEATLSAVGQQEDAMRRLAEARLAAQQRSSRSLAAKQAEVLARRLELDTLAAEAGETESGTRADEEELAHRRALLQPLRERLTAVSARERELGEELIGARTAQLGVERSAMEAEAALNRHAQALDRLREEMEAEGYELQDVSAGEGRPATSALLEVRGGDPVAGAKTAQAGAGEIAGLQSRVRSLRGRIRQLGPVNAQAEGDFREARERHEFLTSQVSDLQQAEQALQEALEELRRVVRERFRETFHAVNAEFGRYFKTFFGGGSARLVLTEPEDYGESGVDVLAQPPGKRQQHLQLLSGGERSMTAVALLFALLETNPAPFCVLDEVDAALDEANVGRFAEALQMLAGRTQFVLITHNRHTIQAARTIYGISMGGDGVSSVLSLRLEDLAPGA